MKKLLISLFTARYTLLMSLLWLALYCFSSAQQFSPILSPTKSLRQFTLDAWNTDHGIPQAPIRAIAHTPDGYTWLGTFEGLVRFDGYRFTVFDSTSTIQSFRMPNPSVHSLHVDTKGVMWIAGASGVWQYQNAAFTQIQLPDSSILEKRNTPSVLGAGIIYSAGTDHEGNLIISTIKGTTFLRDERTKKWEIIHTTNINANMGQAIIPSRVHKGVTWLVLSGRLYQWSQRTLTPMSSLAYISSCEESPDGTIWIGNIDGLHTWQQKKVQHILTKQHMVNPHITGIFHEVNGSVWLATRFGLYRWFQGVLSPLTEQEGLVQSSLYCLHKDSQGNLWIGGVGGIFMRLRENAFTTLTQHDGLANNMVRSILQDSRGTFWFATAQGLTSWNGKHYHTYRKKNGLPDEILTGLHEDRNKTLWIGTANSGLIAMKKNTITHYSTNDGLPSNSVRVIAEDGSSRLWVGTALGLCYRKNGLFHTAPFSAPGLGRIWSMKKDTSTGNLWIGSANNLLIAVRGDSLLASYSLEYLTRKTGIPYPVLTVHPNGKGRVWFGFSRGIGFIEHQKVFYVNTTQGLFDDDIYSIIEDGKGNIWTSGFKGVYRIPAYEFDSVRLKPYYRIQYAHFKKSDGLKNAETNGGAQPSVCLAKDGSLWYPTILGASYTIPMITMPTMHSASPIIEFVTTSDTSLYLKRVQTNHDSAIASFSVEGKSEIILPYSTRKIEINFTLPEYRQQTRLRFRYKLEGFDNDWIEVSNRRTVYYTNLPYGTRYKFRLQSYFEGAPLEYAESYCIIIISEQFYTTWWFITSIVILFVTGLFLIYRWRIWRIKARNILLEELVQQRTLEIQEQSAEIHHINQQLVRQNQRLVEVDSEKNAFFGVVIHDLKNPLASISLSVEMLEMAHTTMPEQKRQKIIHDIANTTARMTALVRNLLNINLIEQGYNNFDIRSHALHSLLEAVIRDYINKSRQKSITLYTSIDSSLYGLVDSTAFIQIADNLLSNAVKYTPPGRTISIALHKDSSPRFFVLSIRDEGPGFTQDDRKYLYGKFARLSAKPTGDESSTGLGLSIVKEYVERMNGSIHVEDIYDEIQTENLSTINNEHIKYYLDYHRQATPTIIPSGSLFVVKLLLDIAR